MIMDIVRSNFYPHTPLDIGQCPLAFHHNFVFWCEGFKLQGATATPAPAALTFLPCALLPLCQDQDPGGLKALLGAA